MAGENSQDFNRPKHDRMTEQQQTAEQGLEKGSQELQQQAQQGQRPQRKQGDHPGGSVGDNAQNVSESGPDQFTQDQNRFPQQDEQGQPQRQPRGEEEDASGQPS